MDNEEKLYNLARTKNEAEEKLYQRLDAAGKLSKLVYIIMAMIVAAVAWIVTINAQVNYNTRAIQKLWLSIYHQALP